MANEVTVPGGLPALLTARTVIRRRLPKHRLDEVIARTDGLNLTAVAPGVSGQASGSG
jgi:hypothetical protein